MWSIAGQFSVSLEIYGQVFKVKILCVLSNHVQLLGHKLGVGAGLRLTRAELLPDECNGGMGERELGVCARRESKHWTLSLSW